MLHTGSSLCRRSRRCSIIWASPRYALKTPSAILTRQHFRGYSPLFAEKATKPELESAGSNTSLGSLSEAFDIGYELAGDLCKGPNDPPPKDEFGLHGPNQWPGETLLPGLKETFLEYYASILELARGLTRSFALALGQDEGFLDSALKYPGAMSRIVHYPPQPVPGEEVAGLKAHTVLSPVPVAYAH